MIFEIQYEYTELMFYFFRTKCPDRQVYKNNR